jgi:hypothetical protein
MFTFSKPVDQITEGDLQRLVNDQIGENRHLEYKRELPGFTDAAKREFVRDVVSFANGAGGHIIFGMAESNGVPSGFAPIAEDKIDEAKLRLKSIIRTSIEPAIQGLKIDSVRLTAGRALIIEIPRGLFGLHMIKNRGAFVTRTSAGKADLDVNEIRAAFLGAETAIQRLSGFRADRTARILSGDIPWSLSGKRIITMHLLPVASFSSGFSCAIGKVPEEARNLLYSVGRRPAVFRPTFTFEGYANLFAGNMQRVEWYSQLFRNGAIENVNATLLETSRPEDATQLYYLEILIMDCAERMLHVMDLLDIPGPYYLLIALLNAKGVKVTPQQRDPIFDRDIRTIDADNLILPEVFFENTGIPIEGAMRSSFDMIWNAAGWARSFSYDEDGQFNVNWRNYFR